MHMSIRLWQVPNKIALHCKHYLGCRCNGDDDDRVHISCSCVYIQSHGCLESYADYNGFCGNVLWGYCLGYFRRPIWKEKRSVNTHACAHALLCDQLRSLATLCFRFCHIAHFKSRILRFCTLDVLFRRRMSVRPDLSDSLRATDVCWFRCGRIPCGHYYIFRVPAIEQARHVHRHYCDVLGEKVARGEACWIGLFMLFSDTCFWATRNRN